MKQWEKSFVERAEFHIKLVFKRGFLQNDVPQYDT